MTIKTDSWLCGGVVTQRIANPVCSDIFLNNYSYLCSRSFGKTAVNMGRTWAAIGKSNRALGPLLSSHHDQEKIFNDFSDGADFILHTHNLIAPNGVGMIEETVKW